MAYLLSPTRLNVCLAALALLSSFGCSATAHSGSSGGGNDATGGAGTGGENQGAGGSGGAACAPEQEICDGLDNDCDDLIDEADDLPGGCACSDGEEQDCYSGPDGTEGVGACAKGKQTCVAGQWADCASQVTPATEACNLIDDDCNGVVDDMPQTTCGVGGCAAVVDTCVAGELQPCVPSQPQSEVCDSIDNDCDQLTDEDDPAVGQSCVGALPGVCGQGVNVCTAGALTCVGPMPTTEVCDGLDNDCDGSIDDNVLGTGGMCSTGALGVCSAGVVGCQPSNGVYVIDCFSIVPATPELCDGLDNDCNGQTDDGDPEGGGACVTGLLGVCQPGVLHCVGGAVQCVQITQPSADLCDGIDNNCDGQVDENNPGGGAGCGTGLPGACANGTTSCTGGAIVCNQTVFSQPEVCNGLDDNCNGQSDEGNPGGGAACATGNQGVCSAGTITCQSGALNCQQNVQPSGEICGNAIDENCDGLAPPAQTIYFSEGFANNAAGWTLGANWSIGPTVMSASPGSCGLGDPAADHTPTADNGVAGNVLGGNIPTAIGGPYYITSPVINTSAYATVYLEYWRWLHSDYPPFMTDRVEVYDGSTWITVWTNPGTVTNDLVWTLMSHNVTAYKNANFRVRFSYQIGSSGVYTCSGWNIDDIALVDTQCN